MIVSNNSAASNKRTENQGRIGSRITRITTTALVDSLIPLALSVENGLGRSGLLRCLSFPGQPRFGFSDALLNLLWIGFQRQERFKPVNAAVPVAFARFQLRQVH